MKSYRIELTAIQANRLMTLLESVSNGHDSPYLARIYMQIARKIDRAMVDRVTWSPPPDAPPGGTP